MNILVGQHLPGGCGFKVVKVIDANPRHQRNVCQTNYRDLRKWCKQNCSGIWGYSASTHIEYSSADQWNSDEIYVIHYFAFVDQIDITAVGYYMGLVNFRANTMWPASMKFNIYFPDGVDMS